MLCPPDFMSGCERSEQVRGGRQSFAFNTYRVRRKFFVLINTYRPVITLERFKNRQLFLIFMEYPALDESTQRELNGLELTGNRQGYGSVAYGYGFLGLAHILLFREARSVVRGEVSLDTFVEKCDLRDFSGQGNPPLQPAGYRFYVGGFSGSSSKIAEQTGVFLTKDLSKIKSGRIHFVYSDYINVLWDLEKEGQYDQTANLAHRRWLPEDFMDSELVENGIRFGKVMWANVVKEYESLSKMNSQSDEITEAGRKLIAYYDQIVNAPNP